jgi:hypothetical protein
VRLAEISHDYDLAVVSPRRAGEGGGRHPGQDVLHEADHLPGQRLGRRDQHRGGVEAVIGTTTTDTPRTAAPGPVAAAVSLRAALPQTSSLSAREQALLEEWLDRIAATP